jgi:magnesium transporter
MPHDVSHAVTALNEDFLRRYPAEAARAAADMHPEDIAELLKGQPVARAIAIWQQLPLDLAAVVLQQLGDDLTCQLLNRADAVRSARAYARLREGRRERLRPRLAASRVRELEHLMHYPANSAGALMDTNFPLLTAAMTAREALNRLRQRRTRAAQQFYFTSEDEPPRLYLLDIQELAFAEPRSHLIEIARPAPAAVAPTAGQEEIVEQFDRQKLAELPVTDVNGELVGVIHYDALVSAVREDSSADLLTMVGASREERALSKVNFVVRKRLPWLQINLLTAFLAAAVVGVFESTIAQFTALAVLLPVVAGQSGNTGAQALAVTMRGLALREISISHWGRVARKELGAGFINGIAVALVTAIGVMVWSGSGGLALVIGCSMVISMVAAGFSGVVIPMLLSAAGQDPAQSSSIILTTITDVVGFFTFLGIATLLSGLL